MQICFFSDDKAANFYPLTLTRPVDDLRIGIFTIKQKWEYALQAENISRIVPKYLEGIFPKGDISGNKDCYWINSRYLPSQSLIKQIQNLEEDSFLTFDSDIVAAKIGGKQSREFFQQDEIKTEGLNKTTTSTAKNIQYLWDLISLNSSEIEYDIPQSKLIPLVEYADKYNFVAQKTHNIFVSKDVIIEPGCTFIAEKGPIVIQSGATIEAGSILRGPVAVCEQATVKMASRIYGGTTIGPVCKVGGEVSGCIFHSYTNKAHDGFTGSSLFGQWVNLGANTITSNLKNDYSSIKIVDWSTEIPIDTTLQFFGTVMADHSKTAINTMLNTGTLCGVSSNIFIDELSPKRIPSFSWVGSKNFELYRFEKALEVMQAMMKRRSIKLSKEYHEMMKYIFENR
ncbi:MAG: putative sugar nucleotidyl transferase [Balneolaceae bacterium]